MKSEFPRFIGDKPQSLFGILNDVSFDCEVIPPPTHDARIKKQTPKGSLILSMRHLSLFPTTGGGTAPECFALMLLQRVFVENFLRNLASENSKEVLQLPATMSFDEKMNMISTNRFFINTNMKAAREFVQYLKDSTLIAHERTAAFGKI